MSTLLNNFMSEAQIIGVGTLITFVITFLALKFPLPFLPVDKGREYALNGQLSKGKVRGTGLLLVICFVIGSLLFMPINTEYVIYLILLSCMMLSGYLDDASDKPWSDYKKGLIDFVIAAVTMWTFVTNNSTAITVGVWTFELPKLLYAVLGVVLLWVSVNVTNCTDGVDGLCASVVSVSLIGFSLIFGDLLASYALANYLLISVLFAYLCFNSSPSSMLMGDAGSRALGFYLALIAMKTGRPFIFILLAGVLIVDGGLGLVKIFLKRFLKISIWENIRMPIHDHMRKKHLWSDTQVVVRFSMIQVLLAVIAYIWICG